MTTLSRRGFFKSLVPQVDQEQRVEHHVSVVSLGHLAAYPVHSTAKIKLMNDEFLIESLPEGLRLKNLETNENIKLSLNNDGLIQAHLREIWPSAAVLSILTGEIYNL